MDLDIAGINVWVPRQELTYLLVNALVGALIPPRAPARIRPRGLQEPRRGLNALAVLALSSRAITALSTVRAFVMACPARYIPRLPAGAAVATASISIVRFDVSAVALFTHVVALPEALVLVSTHG
jgi:hypothetical protein